MRALRRLVPAIFAVALVPFAAGPASAAAPGNDEPAGAVAINLGDSVSQDTSEATTNAGDDALNVDCQAPFTSASVWYQYTPSAAGNVVLDTSESSYTAGLMVFEGTPAPDSLIACGPGAVGLQARFGHTYTIMAFSDTAVNGGTLVLSLTDAPTPVVHVSMANRGVTRHGSATLHGSYSCKHGEGFAGVNVHLRQRAGRLKIQADSGTDIRCNGKRHKWTVRLVSQNGTYAHGDAVAKVAIFACGILECRQAKTGGPVHLALKSGPQRQWMTHPTTARVAGQRQIRWPSS